MTASYNLSQIGSQYSQTAAELAANVTPTNYGYPPLNVRRYGAVLNGSMSSGVVSGTDDTAAFNAAIIVANAAGGGTVTFDGPARVLNITAKDKVSIQGVGNPTMYVNPTAASDQAINAQGSWGISTALTGTASVGARTVTVTSSSGLSVGQYVQIGDLTYVYGTTGTAQALYPTSTNGQNREINRITGIAGTTITLEHPLIGTYTIGGSQAAALTVVNAISNFQYSGFQIAIATGTNGGGMFLQLCADFDISRIQFWYPAAWPACRLVGCAHFTFTNNRIQQGQGSVSGGSSGLALDIIEGSHNWVVTNNIFEWYNQVEIGMRARHGVFSHNICRHPVDDAVNTHGNLNSHILISDNQIDGSENTGIAVGYSSDLAGDSYITVRGNKIRNSGGNAISVASSSGKEHTYVRIQDNDIQGVKLTSSGTSGGIFCNYAIDLLVAGNFLDGTTIGNTADNAISVVNSNRVKVTGNKVRNFPSGYGIQMTSCSNYDVAGNDVSSVAANTAVYCATSTGTNRVVNNYTDGTNATIESATLQWGNTWNGTPTQLTGWGTPTGGTTLSNFPGGTATLAQTSGAVAQIISSLKAFGLFAT